MVGIIQRILSNDILLDMEYVKTFLLTYQSFTTPAKLLQKLIQRYHVPIKEGLSEEDMRKISTPIQLR